MLRYRAFVLSLALIFAPPSYGQAEQTTDHYADQITAHYTEADRLYREGKHDEAIALVNRTMAMSEQHLGPSHAAVAVGHYSLARVYRAQGKYAQAILELKRSVAVYEKAWGPDHRRIAKVLDPLAELSVEAGRYDEALNFYERALQIREKAYGPLQRSVADTLDRLAALHASQGRLSEAERYYKRSVKVSGAFGEVPDLAALTGLAALYRDLGRYEEAESLLELVAKTLDESVDDLTPPQSLSAVADFYREQGRLAEAEPLYDRALKRLENKGGREHPRVSPTLVGLARLYQAKERYDDAAVLFGRDLEIMRKTFGPDHSRTAESMSNLAQLHERKGDAAQAASLYGDALGILEGALGQGHLRVATALDDLARVDGSEQRYRQAEQHSRRALSIREQVLGGKHTDVADSLSRLALIYEDQERYEEAEPLQRRALSIQEEALGPNHPHVGVTLQNLALLYEKLNNVEAATKAMARLAQIPEAGTRHVPLFFATNRKGAAEMSFGTDLAKVLSFGQITMQVPAEQVKNRAGRMAESLGQLEKARTGKLTAAEALKVIAMQPATTPAQFAAAVRSSQSRAVTFQSQALVFVHGYNNDFDGAMKRATQLAFDLQFDGVVIPFTWPSQGMVLDYLTDGAMAMKSIGALVGLLDQLRDTMPELKVHLLGHSMGNRVLLGALCAIAKRKNDKPHNFGEVIAAHADVGPEEFEELTDCFKSRVRGTTLYINEGDTALSVRCGWFFRCRAGNLVRGYGSATAIDTTQMSRGLFRSLTKGFDHDIFVRNPVLFGDLHRLILTGERRVGYRTQEFKPKLDENRNWFWYYDKAHKPVAPVAPNL